MVEASRVLTIPWLIIIQRRSMVLACLGLAPMNYHPSSPELERQLALQVRHRTIQISVMAQILSKGPSPQDVSRQILDHNAPQYTFSFTPFLANTYRHGLSPSRPTCKAYLQGHCPLGGACPDKHTSASSSSNFNNLVCKHWLRGLCKKGESCEFLHEFNLRKMPECNFFVRNGYCSNGGM